MDLVSACEQMLSERDVDQWTTARQYRRAVERFNEYLGKPAMSDDLTHDNLNKWLPWLAATYGSSPITQRNYRRAICGCWNYLARVGQSEGYTIARLRQPKAPLAPPKAWSQTNVAALLRACDDLPGRLKIGLAAGAYMRAWILCEHATGFRPSDMRLLKWADIDPDHKLISITQHKTGNSHTGQITDEAIAAMQAIRLPDQDRIFPLGAYGTRRIANRLFKEAAKHGFRRAAGQGIGTLRKVHATEVCRVHGLHVAAESLGHVSGSRIARAHYVQPDAMRPGSLPPPLPVAERA